MPNLIDRFVCRREGHQSSLVIGTGGVFLTSFIAPCVRCGHLIETTCSCPEAGLDPMCPFHGSTAGDIR